MSKKTLESILPQRYGHQYPEGLRTVHRIAAEAAKGSDSFGIWLQQQADAAGKQGLINPNSPWENGFKTVIRNVFNKSGKHRDNPSLVEEAASAILMKIDSNFLGNYDPTKGTTIQQYIFRRVQQRAMDYLKVDHGTNRRVDPTTRDEDGNTIDPMDQISNDDVTDPEDRPEFQMEYRDLVRSIKDYLQTTNRAEWYTRIFSDILEGNTRQDIIKKYGVSSAIITRYIGGLEEELRKYAQQTDNELLGQLLAGGVGRRKKSADGHIAIELADVFKEYKEMSDSHTASSHTASQHVIKPVTVLRTPNRLSQDGLSELIQDMYLGDSQIKDETDTFIEKIAAADDIIAPDDASLAMLFS